MIERPPEITVSFWDSMSAEQHVLLMPLIDGGLILLPTGSRIICPDHARPDSDWDLYCFCGTDNKGGWQTLGEDGWEVAQSANNTGGYSAKKTGVNIIAFSDPVQFDLFHTATRFCISISGPKDREKRIALFETIRSSRKWPHIKRGNAKSIFQSSPTAAVWSMGLDSCVPF